MNDPPTSEQIALIVAAVAVVLRGLVAAAGTALLSTGREDVDALAEANPSAAGRIRLLKEDADETIISIRLGEMTLFALTTTLIAYATIPAVEVWFTKMGLGTGLGVFVAATAVVLVTATGMLLLAEILPRAWASRGGIRVAGRLWIFAIACRAMAFPAVRLVFLVSDKLLAPRGLDLRRFRPMVPLEDLEEQLADLASRDSAAPDPELIHSIFEFGETSAKEVMIPRTQVVAIEVGASPGEVLSTIAAKGHTRLPVYRGDLDNIVGIINSKDLIPLVERGEPIELGRILRPAVFVPWAKPIDELMRDFQLKHIHMAMVVDEFGGLMGLITLEDILEEIVGEIEDEFDPPEDRDVDSLSDGSFLVRASIEVEEFNQRFESAIPVEGEYETLAGFLYTLSGTIPSVGDTFLYGGLQLQVAKRSEKRVRQVRVRRVRSPARPES